MQATDLQQMFNTALASEVGVKITTTDNAQFRQRFYSLRAKLSKSPAFKKYLNLKLLSTNIPNELWLVKASIVSGEENVED